MKWVRQRCQLAPGEHLGYGGLNAAMGVGNDQFDPVESPGHEGAQELCPGGAVLGGDDLKADDENHGNSPESITEIPHPLRAAVGH